MKSFTKSFCNLSSSNFLSTLTSVLDSSKLFFTALLFLTVLSDVSILVLTFLVFTFDSILELMGSISSFEYSFETNLFLFVFVIGPLLLISSEVTFLLFVTFCELMSLFEENSIFCLSLLEAFLLVEFSNRFWFRWSYIIFRLIITQIESFGFFRDYIL